MSMMSKITALALASGLALAAAPQAQGAVITLGFEGLDGTAFEPVGNFYNGGTGGNGSGPGPNFGITFSSNALAVGQAPASNTNGMPTPPNALFFLGGTAATMNVLAGFTTGFSFFYTSVNVPGFINVYDGLNATGNILATLALPLTPSGGPGCVSSFCPYFPVGVAFSGTAFSVDFGGTLNQIAFDNITLGSQDPTGVPVPASLALFGLGLLGLGAVQRRAKAA